MTAPAPEREEPETMGTLEADLVAAQTMRCAQPELSLEEALRRAVAERRAREERT